MGDVGADRSVPIGAAASSTMAADDHGTRPGVIGVMQERRSGHDGETVIDSIQRVGAVGCGSHDVL